MIELSHRKIGIAFGTSLLLCGTALAHGVFGFGNNEPLSVAAKAIAPAGSTISYGPGVDRSMKVSWSGDAAWPDVMSAMLGKAGLSDVVHSNHILIVRKSSGTQSDASGSSYSSAGLSIMASPAPKPAAKPQSSTNSTLKTQALGPGLEIVSASGGAYHSNGKQVSSPVVKMRLSSRTFDAHDLKSGMTVAQLNRASLLAANPGLKVPAPGGPAVHPAAAALPAPPPPPPAIQTWTLHQNHATSVELEHWAAIAGWHVVWNGKMDWVVPVTTSLSGNFVQAATKVINALGNQGAKINAKFFYGNHTLLITEPGGDDGSGSAS